MEKLSNAYLSISADMIDDWCRGCRDAKSSQEIVISRENIDLVLDILENSWREVNTDASRLTTALKKRCQVCFENPEGRGGALDMQYTCAIRINLPQTVQEA